MDSADSDTADRRSAGEPDKDNSSSEDDFIPLSKLLEKPKLNKSSRDNGHSLTSNTNSKTNKDDSSDDEPQIKKKKGKKKAAPSKPEPDTDGDSDNEPLIKIAKTSKPAKKRSSVTPKKSANRKREASPDKHESSDDEPLIEIAKKLQPRQKRRASLASPKQATPGFKSQRNAARKSVNYAETHSEHSSDDEPLATLTKKRSDAPKDKTTSSNRRGRRAKTQKDSSSSEKNSDEDDVPLTKLVSRKKNAKKSNVSRGRLAKKTKETSDGSSDDEPLVHPVKTNKTKASTQKKKTKSPRKKPPTDESSNVSEDEATAPTLKHPQVTKTARVLLKRCDVGGSAAALTKSRPAGRKAAKVNWEGSSDEE
ncbi:nucleolin 1 [Nematolebias whitei]|uniref:nucleolin 1 n=1 Tax=Nematolebias whitei TaxID=451745 RepID=UPI00189A2EBD|nr:nucleolin 1 [Nematolebias whitei]XP_037549440.1 nucleolin 1 [Nematolebias whitei]